MAKNNFVAEVTFNKIIWFSNIYSTAMKTSFRHYDVALQIFDLSIYETLCVIWHYLYNSKNMKNAHGGVIFWWSCRLHLAILLNVSLFHGCISRFLKCTNSTKPRKASHMLSVKYSDNSSEMNKLIEIVCLWLNLMIYLLLVLVFSVFKNYPATSL